MKEPDGTLPHFYQVVLKVRSMDDMPIDIAYIFDRDLTGRRKLTDNKRSLTGH